MVWSKIKERTEGNIFEKTAVDISDVSTKFQSSQGAFKNVSRHNQSFSVHTVSWMRSEFKVACRGMSNSCLSLMKRHSVFSQQQSGGGGGGSSSKPRASQLVLAPEAAGRESLCQVRARFKGLQDRGTQNPWQCYKSARRDSQSEKVSGFGC